MVEREVSVEYRNCPVHDSVQKYLFNLRISLGSATPWNRTVHQVNLTLSGFGCFIVEVTIDFV